VLLQRAGDQTFRKLCKKKYKSASSNNNTSFNEKPESFSEHLVSTNEISETYCKAEDQPNLQDVITDLNQRFGTRSKSEAPRHKLRITEKERDWNELRPFLFERDIAF
jgi:hypothetical protein